MLDKTDKEFKNFNYISNNKLLTELSGSKKEYNALNKKEIN